MSGDLPAADERSSCDSEKVPGVGISKYRNADDAGTNEASRDSAATTDYEAVVNG